MSMQYVRLLMPWARVHQGDVGCGKTAVAFLALLAAAGSGYQGAIMLPTEILAAQTHAKLGELLASLPQELRPSAAMLTGSTRAKERREARAAPHPACGHALVPHNPTTSRCLLFGCPACHACTPKGRSGLSAHAMVVYLAGADLCRIFIGADHGGPGGRQHRPRGWHTRAHRRRCDLPVPGPGHRGRAAQVWLLSTLPSGMAAVKA